MTQRLMTIASLIMGACIVASSLGCMLFDDEADRPGFTECGDFLATGFGEKNYCQPGQYCFDAAWSDCRPGCTSNVNCAEDQRCVKSDGDNVGTCQNAKQPATNPRPTPGPSGQGFNPCGDFGGTPVVCEPGQYCADPRFSRCLVGCLSDQNCGPNQLCYKDGGDVGVCDGFYF